MLNRESPGFSRGEQVNVDDTSPRVPDRPTRSKVNTEPARVDDPLVCSDDRHRFLAAAVRALRAELAGVEGERDAADDFAGSVRELLDVADEPGWGRQVDERIRALLAARTPRPDEVIERRLDHLASLAPGWDSYGAERIDPAAIATARSVLAALAVPVHICGTVDGGVQLAWDDEHVTLTIDPGSRLSASVGEMYAEPEAAACTPQPAERPDVIRSVGALRRSGGNVDRWDGRRWVPTVIVAGSTREGPYSEEPAPLPAVPDGEDARRLRWEIFHENGAGVIVTDLDTERWATGSAATEDDARKAALRNLAEHPSGGKRDPRWADDLNPPPRWQEMVADWRTIEALVGTKATVPEATVAAVRALVERERLPGEDVPARLDDAAEALERLHSHGLGYEMRQVADQLRDGDGGTPELRAAVAAALSGEGQTP